jgi:ribosomal protein L11 methyltransferase
MDPGMAFGTGTHATTVLCMQALETVLASAEHGVRVIDVGTGTGILAIAAVKLGAARVLAIDLDQVAVESAQANVALNGVAGQVEVRHGDLLASLAGETDAAWANGADVVVANILADVIVTFVADVYAALRPGGLYITSGIIAAKAPMVQTALEDAGFTMVETRAQADWVALVARKPVDNWRWLKEEAISWSFWTT